jgi:hypothetical protein
MYPKIGPMENNIRNIKERGFDSLHFFINPNWNIINDQPDYAKMRYPSGKSKKIFRDGEYTMLTIKKCLSPFPYHLVIESFAVRKPMVEEVKMEDLYLEFEQFNSV